MNLTEFKKLYANEINEKEESQSVLKKIGDKKRQKAITEDIYQYSYALNIDECSKRDTREASIKKGKGYLYALNIDKCPRDNTRAAAIKEGNGYNYAIHIDRCPRNDTRAAAIKEGNGYIYAIYVDRTPNADTRIAAIKEGLAYYYAKDIDKCCEEFLAMMNCGGDVSEQDG